MKLNRSSGYDFLQQAQDQVKRLAIRSDDHPQYQIQLQKNIAFQGPHELTVFQEQQKIILRYVIFVLSLVTLVIYLNLNLKDLSERFVKRFDLFQLQTHNELQININKLSKISAQARHLLLQNPDKQAQNPHSNPIRCPQDGSAFHIHLNDPKQVIYILSAQTHAKAQQCLVPILNETHLQKLINKWNYDEDLHKQITLSSIPLQKKRNLFILLKLYFDSGIYIPQDYEYSKSSNQCLNYKFMANKENQLLFSQYINQVNQNKVYVPRFTGYIKIEAIKSPMIKKMIQNIINKKNQLEECQKKQCFIIKCKKSINQKQSNPSSLK